MKTHGNELKGIWYGLDTLFYYLRTRPIITVMSDNVISAIWGAIATAVLAAIGWVIAQFFKRPSWRNIYSKEFKVNLEFDQLAQSDGRIITVLPLILTITVTHNNPVVINCAYIVIPKRFRGHPNITQGQVWGVKGRSYIGVPANVTGQHVLRFNLHPDILNYINRGQFKRYLRIVVVTNMFGKTSSNCLPIEKTRRSIVNRYIRDNDIINGIVK